MRTIVFQCLAVLALTCSAVGGQTIAENDAYRVEYIETVKVSDITGDIRHDFTVTPKNDAEPFRLSTNRSWQFSGLQFAGRHLLVHGAIGSVALCTAIVDLDKREIVDSFFHWGVEPSPGGRLLAVKLNYPRMGALEARSSVLAVYDLSLPSEDNRLKPISGDAIDHARQVGIPIYPLENVAPPTYHVWVEDLADIHSVRDVAWLSERHLIFRDSTERIDRIVTADLTNGAVEARVAVADVPDSVEFNPDWKQLINFANDEAISLRQRPCPDCPDRRITLPLIPLADYRRPQQP